MTGTKRRCIAMKTVERDGHVAVSTAEARAEVATEEGLAGAAETATGGSAMVRVVVKEKEEKAVAARVAKARGRW